MATTITDGGNYLILDNGTFKKYVSKPYDVLIRQNIVDIIGARGVQSLFYDQISYPTSSSADALAVELMKWSNANPKASDNAGFDAFGRQRTSSPETIFDSKQIADKQPLFWDDQQTSGSGTTSTYNTNQASTTIAVSNLTAGKRVRQTFRRFNYQPGKSQQILMTYVIGSADSGIKKKLGYFDGNNGLFIGTNGTDKIIGTRTFTSGSAVDTLTTQSNWNLDKLNGQGKSGKTLDFTKCNIFTIDFEWLGVGRVRFGFVIDGVLIYCHEMLNANATTLVYMSNPNLPLRFEIENDGTGAASSLTQICSTVISEGGLKDTGFPFGVTRGATSLQTNNNSSIYPLIALRLNSSYLHSFIKLLNFYVNCTSTATYNFYLMLNPTVTGTALSYTSVTNSSLEADVSTTNATTVSGGTNLFTGTASQTNEGGTNVLINSDFAMGSNIAGTSDVLVLGVQRVTGTSETFYGSINWKDQQ